MVHDRRINMDNMYCTLFQLSTWLLTSQIIKKFILIFYRICTFISFFYLIIGCILNNAYWFNFLFTDNFLRAHYLFLAYEQWWVNFLIFLSFIFDFHIHTQFHSSFQLACVALTNFNLSARTKNIQFFSLLTIFNFFSLLKLT